MRPFKYAIVVAIFLLSSMARAGQNSYHLLAQNSVRENSVRLAQSDDDDAYDPFADYSEFEESMEEEEDLNFFRNGRLLTLGFAAGLRSFTGDYGKYYANSGIYGLNLTFFFDLRFGMQIGFLTSSHAVSIPAPNGSFSKSVDGSIGLTDISLNLKYYFNTQNVTKGLANLNPYLIGGISNIQRTISLRNSAAGAYSKDASWAFNIGAGIEIPMLKNKMYFGAQGAFQILSFPHETVQDDSGNSLGTPTGNSWTGLGILGINF